MRAAVFSIGTEITRGELLNTNANWLAAKLTDLGFEVTRMDCVDDDIPRIQLSLKELAREHGIIICTGGLGPTTDDMTAEAVAGLLGVPLVRDDASLADIAEKFRLFGRPMAKSNEKQADFPQGATVIPNAWGTAPGFSAAIGTSRAYFTPGVPKEMNKLFDTIISKEIEPLAPQNMHQIRMLTYGRGESDVADMLGGIEHENPGITIGYRAHFPEIEVKVIARATDRASATTLAEKGAVIVRRRLGDLILGEGKGRLPQITAAELRAKKLTLALAESCTGGLVSQMLTDDPASDYFLGGSVTYANSAKEALLGVPNELLVKYGAVSEEVAQAMASGIRERLGSTIAVSITGIAGPTGGSDEKPVGTVHIGVSTAKETKSYKYQFRGDRWRIQRHAAHQALKLIVLCARAFP